MQRDQSAETSSLSVDSRETQIRSVVYEYLSRTSAGEPATPDQYHAQYPNLMPELADALLLGAKNLRTLMDAERAMLAEGQTLAQRDASSGLGPRIPNYTLLGEIGSGSQGVVYEAVQVSTGRNVAVKVLSAVSRNSLARFDREAAAMAAFTHPGLVKIIDRGKTLDGLSFLVIEHVVGCNLDAWVAGLEKSRHSISRIVEVFREIAAALGTAHDMGIVHRDLKPSNILIDEYDRPRILDFGLALLANWNDRTLTQKGNVVGSMPWCSPEQGDGDQESVGAASDIYSLGFMLFQSLSDRSPYPIDGSIREIIQAICTVIPEPLDRSSHLPFGPVDAALAEIVQNCLAKNPGQRPQTGAELAAHLSAYREGTYTPATRRRRWRAPISVALGLAAIAGLAWSQRPKSQLPDPLRVELPQSSNAIDMVLVHLPAGSFMMGSVAEEEGHQPNEQRHMVHISRGFAIGKTEVTQSQYFRVMLELPGGAKYDASNAELPVVGVSRVDATDFCRKLGQLDGRAYRLPTEAEWEYACRSGTSLPFAGNGEADQIAWTHSNSGGELQPVASLSPNQWGLYDMQGNATEWVADGYIAFLGKNEVTDPSPVGSDDDAGVLRGGSVGLDKTSSRSSSRHSSAANWRGDSYGFRVAAEIPPPRK